jgi:hypothetical protein
LQKEASQEFQQSMKRVTAPKSSLWNDPSKRLMEIVMVSSLTSCGGSNRSILFLDERASALLCISRKLIKIVSDLKKKPRNKPIDPVDNLFVAVHVLRSIVLILADLVAAEKRETLLKLFYHPMATAGEYVLMDDKLMNKSKIHLSLIIMAGYEDLGYTLSK